MRGRRVGREKSVNQKREIVESREREESETEEGGGGE